MIAGAYSDKGVAVASPMRNPAQQGVSAPYRGRPNIAQMEFALGGFALAM
jgi:hypothetical protein